MIVITPEHLARRAIVYVRQSTAFQVTNNLERAASIRSCRKSTPARVERSSRD
jgi:hypothetical protein